MTNDEYARLVEFVGRKFEEVEAQQTETRRHFDVVGEGLRSQIQLLAETVSGVQQSVSSLQGEMRQFKAEVVAEFAETRAAIRFSYAQLERRIQELEGNYASLSDRVTCLEARGA